MNSGHFGVPGFSAAANTVDSDLFWGGDESRIQVLRKSTTYVSSMADAANTPTTVIRKGMLCGKVTATGKDKEWNPAGTDGSQWLTGVVGVELQMTDGMGTAVDRFAPQIVAAPLKAKSLRIAGAAFVGHASEYLARRMLHLNGCRLDDDPQGFLAGVNRRIITKATNYTVVAADNGTTFVQKTADATFTLPALVAGLNFTFIQSADFEMVVASAAGDDIVVGNDLGADSITFTTAGQQIGAQITVESMYVDGTVKWVATLPYVPFGTGLATMAFGLAS